jgi:hypothetical protein
MNPHAALALLIAAACTIYPPACIPAGIIFYFLATRKDTTP